MAYRPLLALLDLKFDGQFNVLEISVTDCFEKTKGRLEAGSYWKLSGSLGLAQTNNRESISRNRTNCVARSTDFACSQPNCSYHHELESKIVLHARSHFAFEVSPDASSGSVLRFDGASGKYTCSKCPRATADKICFREHLRHHLFTQPYVCPVCSQPLQSIANVRVHFQNEHPKQPSDLAFALFDGCDIVDGIVQLLHPCAKPLARPLMLFVVDKSRNRHAETSYVFPASSVSQSCAPNLNHLSIAQTAAHSTKIHHAARKLKEKNTCNGQPLQAKQDALRRHDMLPSTFSFSGNTYCCHTCSYKTEYANAMRKHAWRHIHGTWDSQCHHGSRDKSVGCPILNGLTEILSKVTIKKLGTEQVQPSVHDRSASVNEGGRVQNSEIHRNSLIGDTGNPQPQTAQKGVKSTAEKQKAINATQHSNRVKSPVQPAFRKIQSMGSRQNTPGFDRSSVVGDSMFILHHDQIPLPVKCGRCSFTCNSNAQLELHSRTCNGVRKRKPGRFNCMHCNMTTDKKNILLWHVAHHTGEHQLCYHECKDCKFATMLDEEITAHEQQHHAGSKALSRSVVDKVKYLQNILKCPVCSNGLMWGSIYFNHLRKDHHLRGLADYLEKTYSNSNSDSDSECPQTISFPRHLLDANNGGDTAASSSVEPRFESAQMEIFKFHCEFCEFSTNDNLAYSNHQKSHMTRAKTLDVGIRSATTKVDDATKYFCPTCAFTSVVEKQFRLHMDDHVKYDQLDNGFMCSICSFKSPSQSRVREHLNSFHSDNPNGEIVKISNNSKKSVSSNKRKVDGSKRKSNISPKSAKVKQVCGEVGSVSFGKHSDGSSNSRSTRNVSLSSSRPSQTEPVTDMLEKFERELPSVQVFARDMKCPVCDFSNRFRVNLIRHLKMHRENARCPSQSTNPSVESRLSFGLWKPLNSDLGLNNSGSRGLDKLHSSDDAVINQEMTNSEDLDAEKPRLGLKLVENAIPRSAIASDTESDQKLRRSSSNGGHYFRCEVCEDRFNTEANLERHITERHNGPYVCHLCGQLMWQKSNVRKHYVADHPGATIMYEVIRREIGDDSGSELYHATGEKKVARIQGVLRSGDVIADMGSLDSCDTHLSTDSARPRLNPLTDVIHTADLQIPSSASGTVQTTTGATSQPPTFVDCGIVIEPKVSALPSIELNVSASMATASHANAASLPSNGLVATHGSSTCVGSTLNTAGDTTAVSNIQWCLPPTATSTNEPPINSAVRSFNAMMSAYSTGQVAAVVPQLNNFMKDLIQQIPQFQQIPQSAWSANYSNNLLSAFGNINIESVKTMLAAQLVPVLASMMANPALLPGLINILGQTVVPNSGLNQQLMAILSQFAATVAQSAKPSAHNSANFELSPSQCGQLNTAGVLTSEASLPSTCSTASASSGHENNIPSVFAKSSSPLASTVAPSSSQSVVTSTSSCSTVSSNARMCNLIPLARTDGQTSMMPRSNSPAPSLSSVGTSISDYESFEFSDDESKTRGRPKRKRKTKRLPPRSSSVASSVSSVRSVQSITRHTKRQKGSSVARDADITVFACNRCSYTTRSRTEYARHIGLELSIAGPFCRQYSADEEVLRRCAYCTFSTFMSDEYQEHLRTHVATKRYRCIYCTFAGFSSKDVRRHMDRHHKGRPFAIHREPRPTRLIGIRNVNFDPVIVAVDVLKMSHRQVCKLMAENDIGAIDFCC